MKPKLKSVIFWSGIIITIAGFAVGTLGHMTPIGKLITPSATAASIQFSALQNGTQITKENAGFHILVETTKRYCTKHRINVPWKTFSIVRFENRHSVATVPVFFAISERNQLLQLRFDWFESELQDIITNARLPWAIFIFIIGIAIMIYDHILDRKLSKKSRLHCKD